MNHLLFKNPQTGFTLIEVMIALLLLSIGLLGVAQLEMTALRMNVLAYQQSVATTQLLSMVHRLKANYPNRSSEIKHWNVINAKQLPEGKGRCLCYKTFCNISLSWKNQDVQTIQIKMEHESS